MADKLLLHKNTRRQIRDVFTQPPQAILIVGPAGSGKEALASHMAARLLEIDISRLNLHPYYLVVEKPRDKSEIPIESIRQIIKSLSLKSLAGGQKVNRLVYLKNAELMSHEAQNALLKILEEPPARSIFILSAISADAILPTIVSRTQKLVVPPLNLTESSEFFKSEHSAKSISSAWSLSQGAAGLMSAILANDQDHPLKKAVDMSKKFLKLNTYDRMILLDQLGSKDSDLDTLLDGLGRVFKELHSAAVRSNRSTQADNLLKCRRLVADAQASLAKNTSARLVGLNLVLNLPI